MKLNTNIKNLPEDKIYFTEHGYSQNYPWAEIKRTSKTVTLAKIDVKKDPDWIPEMISGGFCAHCANQSDQTWLFDKIDETRTKTIRMTKHGWASKGVRFTENSAIEFYDYNF